MQRIVIYWLDKMTTEPRLVPLSQRLMISAARLQWQQAISNMIRFAHDCVLIFDVSLKWVLVFC